MERKVVIFGASLFLSVIADNLLQLPGLEVICVMPDAAEQIGGSQPDVVIMEYPQPGDAGRALTVLTLLRDNPGLKLIGLDTAHSELVILSSSEMMVSQVADLVPLLT